MPTRYRLRGKRAQVMLPFAEHKLRHMRRYKVPMDAYKDDDYRIIIKHDQFSGIDLIDIKYEVGFPFYVGEVVQFVDDDPEETTSITHYYLVDVEKKTKKFVYNANILHTSTPVGKYTPTNAMNQYFTGFVDVNFNRDIFYDHNLIEDDVVTRRAPVEPQRGQEGLRTHTLEVADPLYTDFADETSVNLKSPYTVALDTTLPGAFENTSYLHIAFGKVVDNRLWGFARAAEPIAGSPNLGNSNGWKDNHSGYAYVVYRDLDSTDLDWTVFYDYGLWTEDRQPPFASGHSQFEEFFEGRTYFGSIGANFTVLDRRPAWTNKAVYTLSRRVTYNDGATAEYRVNRFDYTLPIDDPDRPHTVDASWTKTFAAGSSHETFKIFTSDGFDITTFLQDHTDTQDMLGYVTKEEAGSEYNMWVGSEDDLEDEYGDIVQARGFSGVRALFSTDLETFFPGEKPVSPHNQHYRLTTFWVIKKDVSVVEGVVVDKSLYGLAFGGSDVLSFIEVGYPLAIGVYDADTKIFDIRITNKQQLDTFGFAKNAAFYFVYGKWVCFIINARRTPEQEGTQTLFIDVTKATANPKIYSEFKDKTPDADKPPVDEIPLYEQSFGALLHTTGGVVAGGIL